MSRVPCYSSMADFGDKYYEDLLDDGISTHCSFLKLVPVDALQNVQVLNSQLDNQFFVSSLAILPHLSE